MAEPGVCVFIPHTLTCCGCQNLALMELRVALAVLCANFTFTLAPSMGGTEGVKAAERMALTLHVHGGVYMHCHPRSCTQMHHVAAPMSPM